jgi:hypothetical protein
MTDDNDRDWWRGRNTAISRQRGQEIIEQDAAGESPEQTTFHRMLLGASAYRIAHRVATGTDACKVVYQMIADMELRARDAFKEMGQQADPASEKAREAHFQMRVAAAVISTLASYVSDGAEAEQTFNGE